MLRKQVERGQQHPEPHATELFKPFIIQCRAFENILTFSLILRVKVPSGSRMSLGVERSKMTAGRL